MGSSDVRLRLATTCWAAEGYPGLPAEFEDLVLTGMYFGFTQHLASALHNKWNTSPCSHVVLQIPKLRQHFMTEIKRARGGKLSLEVKQRTGEVGGQSGEDSSKGNRRCVQRSPHQAPFRFRGDYRSLSFLFPLVSPVRTSTSSSLSGLEPPERQARGPPLSRGSSLSYYNIARCPVSISSHSLCPSVPS